MTTTPCPACARTAASTSLEISARYKCGHRALARIGGDDKVALTAVTAWVIAHLKDRKDETGRRLRDDLLSMIKGEEDAAQ